MKGSVAEVIPQKSRVLNAVALEHAVLCAECDVVSDSPHDVCLVCGSRSLFNIARVFGGNLPRDRANVISQKAADARTRETVLIFPQAQRARRRASV